MSYVNISPEKLLEVVDQCLYNIENYNGEDDTKHSYKEFSFLKMRNVTKEYTMTPTWTYSGCGIVTRLKELRRIALNVIKDDKVVDRDIKLTLTTHSNLFLLLNKSKSFEPYVFGMGY